MKEYVVLSRKYRPKLLQDLVGQDVLVKSIQLAITNQKIPHAFLFCGIRGVGKTTISRILARCLNCEHGPTVQPCGICKSCIAMDSDQHLDVVEFDAASRTGVDDMRSVIDSCQYASVNGKYKIFIIDEVHMLSKSAFNALLKTLEEPPMHVKFVFATTEKNKVPETVLSRCVTFQLNQIPDATIKDHIKHICNTEKQEIDDDAAELIASEARGSIRDSISLLEQSIMYCGVNRITSDDVIKVIGGSTEQDTNNLLSLTLLGKQADALRFCQHLVSNAADPYMIFKRIQNALYKMIVDNTLANKHQEFTTNTLLYAWQILLNQSQYLNSTVDAYQVLSCAIVIIAKTAQFPETNLTTIDDSVALQPGCQTTERQNDLANKISAIVGERINAHPPNQTDIDMLAEIKKSFGATSISEIDRSLISDNLSPEEQHDEESIANDTNFNIERVAQYDINSKIDMDGMEDMDDQDDDE